MRSGLALLLLTLPAFADELTLKNGTTIEWKSVTDKGEKFEVVTMKGEKLSIPKTEIEKLTAGPVQEPLKDSPLTGATFVPKQIVPAGEIDLLKLVDLKKDSSKGEWEFVKGGSLVCSGGGPRILQIPFQPGEEYDLKLTVERKDPERSFNVNLVLGGKYPTMLVLGNSASGLHQVDGKPIGSNPSTFEGSKHFEVGKAADVVIAVRKDSLGVTIDGKIVFTWKGADFKRCSQEGYWGTNDPKSLAIGSMATFGISRISVLGQGKKLR